MLLFLLFLLAQVQPVDHAPVILRVVERQEVIDGAQWYFQDIYFSDPDGDVAAMTYQPLDSTLSYPLFFSDDPITLSALEQQSEALFTVQARCWQKLELSFESRLRDAAGNLSEPVHFSMSCTTPPAVDTPSALRSGLVTLLPILGLLVLGFWLLFRRNPEQRLPALRSLLLMFFLFSFLKLLQLVLHEGGHSLYYLVRDVPVTLYVHPFHFSGYAFPMVTVPIWKDILGSLTALPVAALIYLLAWKRRSPRLLPLVMLAPYILINDGFNIMGFFGDFRNLAEATGLPGGLFMLLGAAILLFGVLTLFALLPFAGLDPGEAKALFVLPAAMFLISALSFPLALLFVPGSAIDLEYFAGREIVQSAGMFALWTGFGLLLGLLYVTLYRKLYPRLPAWLRSETVELAWRDLRLPAILWAISLVIGLVIVI